MRPDNENGVLEKIYDWIRGGIRWLGTINLNQELRKMICSSDLQAMILLDGKVFTWSNQRSNSITPVNRT